MRPRPLHSLRLSPVGMAPVEQRAPAQPPRDQRGDTRCRGSAAASTAPTDGYGTGRDDSSRAASIPNVGLKAHHQMKKNIDHWTNATFQ